MSKILVTGGLGQIGSELVPALQSKYGRDNVIVNDINHVTNPEYVFEQFDVLDSKRLLEIVEKYQIDTIYHLVALLSVAGEKDPGKTWNLNTASLKAILDLAKDKKLKVFWPSSIAVFGPTTPKENTPQQTICEPITMYGVTKYSGELLCQYYSTKYSVDVRSLRLPGIISFKTPPGGGTTDYAVAMFLNSDHYTCFVEENTKLPMMYVGDAIDGILKLIDAPISNLTVRTAYNVTSFSFTAKELEEEIQKYTSITVEYESDHRQQIADSWPNSINDSIARRDWGWSPKVDFSEMVKLMMDGTKKKNG